MYNTLGEYISQPISKLFRSRQFKEAVKKLIVSYSPIGFAVSDETTALSTGTSLITFRMPYEKQVSMVRATLTTEQTSGTKFTVDILQNGVSIFSTLLTIDNGEKTSTTAVIQSILSTTTLLDDAEITVDINQVGDGTATGLKVWLI